VLVFDSDGRNPYGAEIAQVIRGRFTVLPIVPSDCGYFNTEASLALRATRGDNRKGRLSSELVTMWRVLIRVLGGSPIVIVWARSYQELVLGMIAPLARGPILFIHHNPFPGRAPRGWRQRIRRLMLSQSITVVHGRMFEAASLKAGASQVRCVPHLKYNAWFRQFGLPRVRRAPGEPLRLAVLGAGRADKWSKDDLTAILSGLAASGLSFKVTFCIRPHLSGLEPELMRRAALDNRVEIVDRSSDAFISDEAIAATLAECDVLLAPYSQPTESGTIMLALTTGCAVITYRGGTLSEYLSPRSLVPLGQVHAFVAACIAFWHDGWDSELDQSNRQRSAEEFWLTVFD
jgi:hypothetical protein